jgi:hypothetical protein
VASGGAHKLRTRGFVAAFNALQSFASAVSLDAIPKELLVEVVKGDGVRRNLTTRYLRSSTLISRGGRVGESARTQVINGKSMPHV